MSASRFSTQLGHPTLRSFALFNLGFRPFFLFASVFAFISMLIWGGMFVYGWPGPRLSIAPMQWHAHEMLFGYAMAVIAGFLLTAVRNWTSVPTLSGLPLAGLMLPWLAARVVWLLAPTKLGLLAVLDLTFALAWVAAITIPLVKAKQMKQLGVASKVLLLGLANGVFYCGALGWLEQGVRWGLYSGVYLILSLIFVMARRVVPFFIERGVDAPVQLVNHAWVDRSSLVLLLLLWVLDVFAASVTLAAVCAGALVAVHGVRLAGWRVPGVWKKPMLWVLFLGYGGAVFGFLLRALTPLFAISPYLTLHAYTVGGIALMTVGMMARVSLGHTGRSIQTPPRAVSAIFGLLALAFVARVVLPLFDGAHDVIWMGVSQAAWLAAFALFVFVYAPMWVSPRADGAPG